MRGEFARRRAGADDRRRKRTIGILSAAATGHDLEPVEPATYALDDEPGSEDDLEARTRSVLPTHELVPANAWYGMAALIKAYARWDPARPLRIVFPHGIEFEGPMSFRRRETFPVVVHVARGLEQAYRDMGLRRVWRMPAPFLHVPALGLGAAPGEAQGTVVFPPHSYRGHAGEGIAVDVGYRSLERVVADLVALPAHLHPVTVCMYYVDVAEGRAQPYLDAGLRVVCAGHRDDPRFLVRLHRICASHRFAAGTCMGSHVFYSIVAGCRFLPMEFPMTWDGISRDRSELAERSAAKVRRMVDGRTWEQQSEAIGPLVGADIGMSPAQLRDLLRAAERLDLVGVARRRVGARRTWHVSGPWAAARAGRRAARRLQTGGARPVTSA